MIRPDGDTYCMPREWLHMLEDRGYLYASYNMCGYYVQFPFGFRIEPMVFDHNVNGDMNIIDTSVLWHAVMFIERFRGRMA